MKPFSQSLAAGGGSAGGEGMGGGWLALGMALTIFQRPWYSSPTSLLSLELCDPSYRIPIAKSSEASASRGDKHEFPSTSRE